MKDKKHFLHNFV